MHKLHGYRFLAAAAVLFWALAAIIACASKGAIVDGGIQDATLPPAPSAFGGSASYAYPVGPAGGALAGNFPNPTLATDATSPPSGAAGGALAGTYPNPSLPLDAGAANITGQLPPGNMGTITLTGGAVGAAAGGTIATTVALDGAVTGQLPIADLAPGTAGQVALTNASTAAWVTPSGDWTINEAGVSTIINVTGAATGADGGNANQVTVPSQVLQNSTVLRDSKSNVAATGSSATVIYTEQAEGIGTTNDYVIGLVCTAPFASDAGGDAALADMYRADFAFTYQRKGDAGPTIAGASPVALNVRTTGAGAIVTGGAIAILNTSVQVTFGASVGTTFDCSVDFTRVQVQ